MTDELDTQAIRERSACSIGRGPDWDDFDALLVKVDRLRAALALDGPRTHALLIGEEIAELQAENARLRGGLEQWQQIAAEYAAEWKAETARLREALTTAESSCLGTYRVVTP